MTCKQSEVFVAISCKNMLFLYDLISIHGMCLKERHCMFFREMELNMLDFRLALLKALLNVWTRSSLNKLHSVTRASALHSLCSGGLFHRTKSPSNLMDAVPNKALRAKVPFTRACLTKLYY